MLRPGPAAAAAGAVLTLLGGSAGAGSLSPGDTYAYEIVTGSGQTLTPVVTFVSRREQHDGAGQVVLRDAGGRRVFAKGWHFDPHNGEFPDDGGLDLGRRWTTEMTVWRDGEAPIRQSRTCEVVDRAEVEAAGMTFLGAVRIDCAWALPDLPPFRNDQSWYWRDDAGYRLLILATQEGEGIGTLDIRLVGIGSDSFGTPR